MATKARERGIERRGNVYYLRVRVPKKYLGVETRREVNTTLGTDSLIEARARAANERLALEREWQARLTGRDIPSTREAHQAAVAVLQDHHLPYRTVAEIVAGPIAELLARVERLRDLPPAAAAVPALLGGVPLLKTRVSEMPKHHERIRRDHVSAKNPRQLREWRNKYCRAASAFVAAAGDKPMAEISAEDARRYRAYWVSRRRAEGLTTQYVNKQLGYLAQMLDAFHSDLGHLPSDCVNPFKSLALERTGAEARRVEGRKLALPPSWIAGTLLDHAKMAGLNDEARSIAIICAETGARAAEIIDLPPEAIRLDDPIPHIRLAVVEDGEHRREIKNRASTRAVPLLGHALACMRRHPSGFPRYRGKASFSATVNKFIREAGLFPDPPRAPPVAIRSGACGTPSRTA